jgi:hypothetical protein
MSDVFADKNKDFEEWANKWLHDFAQVNRTMLWDRYGDGSEWDKEHLTNSVPSSLDKRKQVYDLLVEICKASTWEGGSKHSARGVIESYTDKVMKVFE